MARSKKAAPRHGKVASKTAKTVKSPKSAKVAKTAKPAKARKAAAPKKPAKPARRLATKKATKTAMAAKPGAVKGVPAVRVVKVRALDPVAKCGPATSVEQLFRVDEQSNGQATVHLVFFDRHGWYCVHGPRCAAVSDVHSHNRTLHRTRAGGR